jgi:hypothetical protein
MPVVKREPGPIRRVRNPESPNWTEVAEQCRANPGEWHLVAEDAPHSFYVSVRQGGVTAVRPSVGFEVTTRNNHRDEDGRRRADLYLRYNPKED